MNPTWASRSALNRRSLPKAGSGVVLTFAEQAQDRAQFLGDAYLDLFHRPIDVGSLSYWNGELAAGVTLDQAIFNLEQSLEYRQDVVVNMYDRYLHHFYDFDSMILYS